MLGVGSLGPSSELKRYWRITEFAEFPCSDAFVVTFDGPLLTLAAGQEGSLAVVGRLDCTYDPVIGNINANVCSSQTSDMDMVVVGAQTRAVFHKGIL